MNIREAIYRLNECECYRAGFRCEGCVVAVEALTKYFKNDLPERNGAGFNSFDLHEST